MTKHNVEGLINTRRLQQWVIAAFLAASVILFLYVAWSSRLLRPGADDYCLAVDADRGIFNGLIYWFQEVSGYITFGFGAMVFVGWPLRNLPLSVASALPFLIAAISVGIAGATISWSALKVRTPKSLLKALVWLPAIAAGWWAFLWMPVTQDSDGISRWMAHGLTHWQTLNGSYVLLTAMVTAIAFVLWQLSGARASWTWAFLPFGLALGFGGAALVGTVVGLASVVLIYMWLAGGEGLKKRRLTMILVLSGCVLGGVLSHLAPGTQSRSAVLGSSAPNSVRALGELINSTLPSGIALWIQSFAHAGSLLLIAVGVALGWMLRRTESGLSAGRGFGVTAILLGFGFVGSLSSRFTELFAYDAYWHFAMTWLLSFLALLVGSLSLGTWLARFRWSWDTPMFLAILGAAVLAVIGALMSMTISMASRAIAWESGPAPLPGMVSDIENPESFEIICWRELSALRELPARSLR